jgi:hypothetical protein
VPRERAVSVGRSSGGCRPGRRWKLARPPPNKLNWQGFWKSEAGPNTPTNSRAAARAIADAAAARHRTPPRTRAPPPARPPPPHAFGRRCSQPPRWPPPPPPTHAHTPRPPPRLAKPAGRDGASRPRQSRGRSGSDTSRRTWGKRAGVRHHRHWRVPSEEEDEHEREPDEGKLR